MTINTKRFDRSLWALYASGLALCCFSVNINAQNPPGSSPSLGAKVEASARQANVAQANASVSTAGTAKRYFGTDWPNQVGPMVQRNNIVPYARRDVYVAPPPASNDDEVNKPDKPGRRYGYRNHRANPFFYDYYYYSPYYAYRPSTAFPTAANNVPYSYYFQYQDSNNDGFFDNYHTYRDRDNDGVADAYELYAFNEEAEKNAKMQRVFDARNRDQAERKAALARRSAERAAREDAGLEPEPANSDEGSAADEGVNESRYLPPGIDRRTIQGSVVDSMSTTVNDNEHMIVRLRSAGGDHYNVDLGPVGQISPSQIAPATEIGATGYVEPIGDMEVLIADELTIDGQLVQIDRSPEGTSGTVVDLQVIPSAGVDHTVAVVQIDDQRELVDFGTQPAAELGLEVSSEITFTAVPVLAGDYRVLMANELIVDGERRGLMR